MVEDRRKNDRRNGAATSGVLYSIAETAKANHLKPYEYFRYVLEEMPKYMEQSSLEFVNSLLPWSPSLPEDCRNKK